MRRRGKGNDLAWQGPWLQLGCCALQVPTVAGFGVARRRCSEVSEERVSTSGLSPKAERKRLDRSFRRSDGVIGQEDTIIRMLYSKEYIAIYTRSSLGEVQHDNENETGRKRKDHRNGRTSVGRDSDGKGLEMEIRNTRY